MLKVSWDTERFKEGLVDEGIPLAGATIGAGLGKGLRGAALGYAAGAGASLLHSKLKGEKPSMTKKLLAGGALGYGLGGGLHGGLEHLTRNAKGIGKTLFHSDSGWKHFTEEAIPAVGATLGTGIAMGMGPSHQNKVPPEHGQLVKRGSDMSVLEEIEKIAKTINIPQKLVEAPSLLRGIKSAKGIRGASGTPKIVLSSASPEMLVALHDDLIKISKQYSTQQMMQAQGAKDSFLARAQPMQQATPRATGQSMARHDMYSSFMPPAQAPAPAVRAPVQQVARAVPKAAPVAAAAKAAPGTAGKAVGVLGRIGKFFR